MKGIVCFCLVAVVATALARPDDKYTNKYDNTNIQDIISNTRLLSAYVDCALDKGKCTAEGKELKSHISDALQNGCERCTDTQKEQSKVVMKHLINKEPHYWKELTAKYDPKNEYSVKYEKELSEIKA